MKRYLLSGIAAIALLAPAASAFAQPEQSRYEQNNGAPSAWERQHGANARDDQNYRDNRENWRDRRENVRWNEDQHNGYYIGNRWAYGPPTMLQVRRGAVPGYQPWAVGRYLGYYNRRFDEIDFRRENLRQPPRGYHWVRDDRGDFLLAGVRSGRIIAVAVSGHQPRDRRQSWRDDRRDSQWDNGRHNGFYRNGRWTYGPPNDLSRGDIVLGYRPWSRGESLGYYQGRYAEVDYRSRRDLPPPPRGYHWVQSDGGDLLLATIATGLIAQVILNDAR